MNPRIALLAAALLAGCATVDRVEFVPPAEPQIRKLAILTIQPPRQVQVANKNALSLLALPAAIVEDVRNHKNSQAYVAEMNGRKKTLAPELAELLRNELGRKYAVVFVNQRPIRKEDNTVEYTHIKTDADAILSVFYGNLGYVALREEAEYLPVMTLGVRLLDARTFKTLYYKQHIVHPVPENVRGNFDTSPSDRRYIYATSGRLMAAFDESYQGLLESQQAIALRIVRDLGAAGQPALQEAKPSDPPAPTGR